MPAAKDGLNPAERQALADLRSQYQGGFLLKIHRILPGTGTLEPVMSSPTSAMHMATGDDLVKLAVGNAESQSRVLGRRHARAFVDHEPSAVARLEHRDALARGAGKFLPLEPKHIRVELAGATKVLRPQHRSGRVVT